MRRAALSSLAWLLVVVAGLPAGARGQDWVHTVFPERAYDFGTVARGSKVHHAFRVVNTTSQEIRIAGPPQPKCGCTDVKVGAFVIPPGTQTVIEAVLDTTKFSGYKASGLTVKLDRPTFAEVDLNLTCFIRSDLVVEPGQVDFGVVSRKAEPTVALTLTYAGGQPEWAVTKMQTISANVSAQLRELARSGGQVQYQLTASLSPEAPAGFLKDEITLFTNDPSGPRIPISVSANIQPGVIVSPSIVNLGRVKPGAVVRKTILVRSAQPFSVTGVQSPARELTATVPPESPKPLHAVTVTFKAPDHAGPFNATLEFDTDLKDEPPAKLTTFATVVP